MPLSEEESIRLTAEGMIRNFGKLALSEADAVAARMGDKRDARGLKLWLAVCDEIRSMQVRPPATLEKTTEEQSAYAPN